MQKGVTLVELLIGLAIISIALSFAVPLWQTDSPKTILAKEQHRLYLFLRQIQARAENSSEVWFLLINRNLATQQWCLTAQVKNDQTCDCLNPTNCPKEAIIFIPKKSLGFMGRVIRVLLVALFYKRKMNVHYFHFSMLAVFV